MDILAVLIWMRVRNTGIRDTRTGSWGDTWKLSAVKRGFGVSSEEGKIVAKLHKKLGVDGVKESYEEPGC